MNLGIPLKKTPQGVRETVPASAPAEAPARAALAPPAHADTPAAWLEAAHGCGSKINDRRGKPRVLVHVSTCQGIILVAVF